MNGRQERLFPIGTDPNTTGKDEWYTPHRIFQAASLIFDMDVAAPMAASNRTCPARRFLTIEDDGLSTEWDGLVWMNPPFSRIAPWVDRFTEHPTGLALLPIQPEVYWLGRLLRKVDALIFASIDFYRPDVSLSGRMRWACMVLARGERCADALARISATETYVNGVVLRPEVGP